MDSKQFFYQFGKALYHLDAIYDEYAKESEVAPTLLWILYALNDNQSHTQKEICIDWSLPKSTVSTVMSELKDKGFVDFAPIKGKRRERLVFLTDSGKTYANQVLTKIYEREKYVFSKLTTQDKTLPAILNKLVQIMREEVI